MLVGTLALAVEQIEVADLPCPVYRSARRLLDMTDATGIVLLNETDFKVICQSEAEGTIRSHLIQMQAAGILRYSRRLPRHGAVADAKILIEFCAWDNPLLVAEEEPADEKMIAQRSNLIDQRSFSEATTDADTASSEKMIDQRSFSRAQRSNLIDQRSFSASTSHARLGRWVGRSLSTKTNKRKKPTYLPKSSHDQGPLGVEQQLAFDLLVDEAVGVIHRVADELARKLPPQEIYRAVDKWLPDAQVGKVTAGALKHRLENLVPTYSPTVTLSADFRDSDLFQRHRLPDEMIADGERRKYSVDDGYPADDHQRKYSL